MATSAADTRLHQLNDAQRAELAAFDCQALLDAQRDWRPGQQGVMYRALHSDEWRFYTLEQWTAAASSLLSAAQRDTVRSSIEQARAAQLVFCWQTSQPAGGRRVVDYVLMPVMTVCWLFTPQ